MKTLGIDFGTTKTIASYMVEGEAQPRSVRLGRSRDELSTAIHLDSHEQYLFGDEADDQAELDYAGYVRCFKRNLGIPNENVLNGHTRSNQELVRVYLEHVIQRAEREALDGKVEHLVVTCPSEFGPTARFELESAITPIMNNRGTFELLDEPVAAAHAWLKIKGDKLGQRILAFDWGGGTLDVAILEDRDGIFVTEPELLGGNPRLGGEDIDDRIRLAIDKELDDVGYKKWKDRPSLERKKIPQTIRRCKELYTSKNVVEWNFPLHDVPGGIYKFQFTRDEFKPWVDGITQKAASCAEFVMSRARENRIDVNLAILIGGSSRLVGLKEHLQKDLEIPVMEWDRCIEAVAWGAAIKAAEKSHKSQSKKIASSRPPAVEDKHRHEKPFVSINHNNDASADGCAPPKSTPQSALVQILTQPAEIGAYLLACEIPPTPSDDYFSNKVLVWDIDLVLLNQSATELPGLELQLFNPADGQRAVQLITLRPFERLLLSPLQLEFLLQEGCLLCLYDKARNILIAKYEITKSDFLNTPAVNPSLPQQMPVLAAWRSGNWSEGAVLRLLNCSTTISLNGITVRSERGKTSGPLAIGPSDTLDIGSFELDTSQNFVGGDVFVIQCPGYLPSMGEIVDSHGNSNQGGGGAKTALAAAGGVAGAILMGLLGG